MLTWVRLRGTVVKGYQSTSGGPGSPGVQKYGKGTLELQTPLLKERGLDIAVYFRGTLNVSIAPRTFTLLGKELVFLQVPWRPAGPPEDFYFSACRVHFRDREYPGLVYYPVKLPGVTNLGPSTLEILAEFIQEIGYGDRVELELNSEEVQISDPT